MEQTNILIVDDDEIVRDFFRKMLEKRGFLTECAEDGAVALEKIRDIKQKYHIVITDIMMPKINGIDLLSEIKSIYPHMEVIMITAHSTLEMALQCIEKGAFAYLKKPFDNIEEIFNIVDKCVERHSFKRKMFLKALSRKGEMNILCVMSML